MKLHLHLSLAIGINCLPVCAAEFQGAKAILQQIAEANAKKPDDGGGSNAADNLLAKIKAFGNGAAALAPADAAAQWLALFDAYLAVPAELVQECQRDANGESSLSLNALVAVLPASNAWDDIIKGMEARAGEQSGILKNTMHLFATILGNDNTARLQAIDSLQSSVSRADDSNFSYYAEMFGDQLWDAIVATAADPKMALDLFERRLKALEFPSINKRQSRDSLKIPSLLNLVEPAQVERLLDRAVNLDVELNVQDKEMHTACVAATIRNLSKLVKPQWKLVQGIDDGALYEELVKKFPRTSNDYARSAADQVYFFFLIAKDRTKEAAELSKVIFTDTNSNSGGFNYGINNLIKKAELNDKLIPFLKEQLTQDPNLPLWEVLTSLSLSEGQSTEFLAFLKQMIAKPGLEPLQLAKMQATQLKGLLAMDKMEEAIPILRKMIQEKPQTTKEAGSEPLEHMVLLMKIGRLMNRQDLVEEALSAADEKVAKSSRDSSVGEFVDELVALHREVVAESVLATQLLRLSRPSGEYRSYELLSILTQLVDLYDKTGRHADVLFLLDNAPGWGAEELMQLNSPLPLIGSRSLAAIGRVDEAKKIVRRVVQDSPGDDAGYELLLKLGGDDIRDLLDQAYAQNRFEERPLIWKAKLLLDQGKLDEAEKTARAAIAVDPSDGEQGKGDRLRAYAVLADILEKKGDMDQAAGMRKALKAIRLSEDADDWQEAGLLSRAVAMYEESLGYFSDAYCIQSRLARHQSDLGEFEKAAEHYRRAFELMPDSFGRVESHCFGCEGTFTDPKAQTVAEKIFARLAEKLPDRAQVFYLYGYLKEAQDKPAEAAALFQKAVHFDPDYLNAWIHLATTAEAAGLAATERDTILGKILDLDPRGARGNSIFDRFSNLRTLWDRVIALEKAHPPLDPVSLYTLTASKAALEKVQDSRTGRFSSFSRYDENEPLRKQMLANPLISSSASLLEKAIGKE
jgi:tetratricopeptide (TPR) repeat protein